MKKFLIAAVLLASFIVCSCEDEPTYDIKVVNSCGFPIKVFIAAANYSWIDLPPSGSYTFSGFESGDYTLRATAPNTTGVPSSAMDDYYLSMRIFTDDTWTISWSNAEKYKVTYRVTQAPVKSASPFEKELCDARLPCAGRDLLCILTRREDPATV